MLIFRKNAKIYLDLCLKGTGLKMRYEFPKDIYTKTALIKAAYNYTNIAYIHLDTNNKDFIVNIEMKEKQSDILERDFLNEMLAQMVRLDIQKPTKNIRELILARAFSSTMIEENEAEQTIQEEININDILKDWFETYE